MWVKGLQGLFVLSSTTFLQFWNFKIKVKQKVKQCFIPSTWCSCSNEGERESSVWWGDGWKVGYKTEWTWKIIFKKIFFFFMVAHLLLTDISRHNLIYLTRLCGMQDFSSPTRDQSLAPYSGNRVFAIGLPGKSLVMIWLEEKSPID